MRAFFIIPTLAAGVLLGGSGQAAQTTPFDLSIVAPVTAIGNGDAKAQNFASTLLPTVTVVAQKGTVKGAIGSTTTISGYTTKQIDPAKINLATSANARLYFIGEGASLMNSIGFNANGPSVNSGTPQLAFLNASTPAPLTPGDYVNLGKFNAGTNLDFFIISDGARNLNFKSPANLNRVFSTDQGANLDGRQHAMAFAIKDTPYLLLSFEDQSGVYSDWNYRDSVLVVDIGASNVSHFFGAPEPSLLLALGSFAAVLMTAAGRRRH
jgi:hypothetical protein